jgi:hypothetical protein
MSPSLKWLMGVGILATIVVIAIVGVGDKKKPAASAPKVSQPKPVVVPDAAAPVAPIEVTAAELFNDYRDNEVGADAKYNNRPLRLKGIVSAVSRDDLGTAFVALLAPNRNLVKAEFADEKQLVDLKKNDMIVAACSGAGMLGTVLVASNCTIAK